MPKSAPKASLVVCKVFQGVIFRLTRKMMLGLVVCLSFESRFLDGVHLSNSNLYQSDLDIKFNDSAPGSFQIGQNKAVFERNRF